VWSSNYTRNFLVENKLKKTSKNDLFNLSILFTFIGESMGKIMKKVIPIVILGVVIMIFGIVFHGQGHGEIGPESSFMYQNPDWITFGFEIAIFGLLIICGSVGYTAYRAKRR